MTIELIKFGADWCPPCKRMEPVIEEFKNLDLCKVTSYDLDESPEEAQKYGIKSIPAFVWTVDGKKVFSSVGMQSLSLMKKTHEQIASGKLTPENLSEND